MAIITVSRLYGSGGSEVAERIAHELGWQLLDNAFVDEVAARLGTPPAEVEAREERLIEVTERIIIEAASRGHSVLVGRGAQSVLAARQDVLHVFCYAPRAALVARAARRLAVSDKDAEKIVDDTNRQRDHYVRTYWKRSWRAHENYHLCLNTDWLGIDGAADIVVRLAREKFAASA